MAAKGRFGRTLLHVSAREGRVDDVEALLSSKDGQDVLNTTDDHGFTPLYHAAMFGHIGVIQLLLGAQADIMTSDLGGLTPLHIACEKGRAETVQCLLDHGADPSAIDSIGRVPKDWALDKGNDQVVAVLERWRPSH